MSSPETSRTTSRANWSATSVGRLTCCGGGAMLPKLRVQQRAIVRQPVDEMCATSLAHDAWIMGA